MDNKVANRLVALRESLHMSQEAVADATGIPRVTITRYENGSRTPRLNYASILAEYYGVSVDYILGRDEPTPSTPVSDLDAEMMAAFRALPSDQLREEILSYARYKAAQQKGQS
ncbi:MAG: helix-turn-helix transcriptional regulator [Clostridia bacterium]|nr:helix-turn-helix transcriptional regulator [Clostridia bacterium]